MKWQSIEKAKNIEFNREVFLKIEKPPAPPEWFGFGRLQEIKQTKEGLEHTFEIATFTYDNTEPAFSTEITHFAIPK